MLEYIRNTMELNRSLYEITNSSNTLNDNSTEEINVKENGRHSKNGLYKIAQKEEKQIKRFYNSYEKYEDSLKTKDLADNMWEMGQNITEGVSVDLSSMCIGRKSKYIYVTSKIILTSANGILNVGCRVVLYGFINLKSLVKGL